MDNLKAKEVLPDKNNNSIDHMRQRFERQKQENEAYISRLLKKSNLDIRQTKDTIDKINTISPEKAEDLHNELLYYTKELYKAEESAIQMVKEQTTGNVVLASLRKLADKCSSTSLFLAEVERQGRHLMLDKSQIANPHALSERGWEDCRALVDTLANMDKDTQDYQLTKRVLILTCIPLCTIFSFQ